MVSEYDQKYHNHKLQTNPWHRKASHTPLRPDTMFSPFLVRRGTKMPEIKKENTYIYLCKLLYGLYVCMRELIKARVWSPIHTQHYKITCLLNQYGFVRCDVVFLALNIGISMSDIPMFYIKCLTIHKAKMHTGAIRKLLHVVCVCTGDNNSLF